jgi:hypothetical protein
MLSPIVDFEASKIPLIETLRIFLSNEKTTKCHFPSFKLEMELRLCPVFTLSKISPTTWPIELTC